MRYYVTLTFFFIINFSCSNAQLSKEQKMKATFQKFILDLRSGDTNKINAYFEKDHNPYDRVENKEVLKDCKMLSEIIDKYGMPSSDSIKLIKGNTEENIVYATLMQKDDSLLNLKKFEFSVTFYPDQFLKEPDKILAYHYNKVPLRKPEYKFLKADPLPNLNKQ